MQIYSQQEKLGKIYGNFPRAICSLDATQLEPLQQSLLYHKFYFNDYTIINLQRINGSSTMFINKRRKRGRKSYSVINFCPAKLPKVLAFRRRTKERPTKTSLCRITWKIIFISQRHEIKPASGKVSASTIAFCV